MTTNTEKLGMKWKNGDLNDSSLVARPAACARPPCMHAALCSLNPRLVGHQKHFNKFS